MGSISGRFCFLSKNKTFVQYQAMQKQIVNMSPQQQREFMHQQQAMIKEVTQEVCGFLPSF